MGTMSRSALPILLFVALSISAAAASAQNLNLQDLEFTGITPCRLIDTRNGSGESPSDGPPAVGARSSPGPYDVAVRTFCGVPATAEAVVLNLTVVAPTQAGDLRVGPTDADPFPVVSTVNYPAGVGALANGAIVPLAAATGNEVRMVFAMAGAGSLHLIVDVAGYFGPPGSGPLWGRGRPGTFMWGQQLGQFLIPCVAGAYQFGLSETAVDWGDAAEACPQGTWVCTAAQRGSGVCNTARTDTGCDDQDCAGLCGNRPADQHSGWLADAHFHPSGSSNAGEYMSEISSSGFLASCYHLPVWCCAALN
jgi:hypothetical protein